jgi:hypothetical protein
MTSTSETDVLDRDVQNLNSVEIDFLLLADRAEAVNGKLYMMGGAWDRMWVQDIGQASPLSFAIGILVPWNATNTPHQLALWLEDHDGASVGFRAELEFAAGRPPTAEQGETQRVVLALPSVPITFSVYGMHVVKATIDGDTKKRVEFRVVPPQQLLQSARPPF